ncbi:MAG: hypothetical protein ISS28_01980 [Candidatus Cloacimonetes bacterium]|nr:hypothetical protein [Candidatus Cloacimonadota bacterium]MBL7085857.1 hypothetical protein [Candidatus Cloacimonadota bacterium]
MKHIAHKSHSFVDAEKWDIRQQINMTPQQRLEAAKELSKRVYGTNLLDVREYHERNKKK